MKFNAERMLRMCLKKRKYKNKEIAEEIAIECTKKYGTEHRVYWCSLCGFYHLTTKKKWRDKENDNSI